MAGEAELLRAKFTDRLAGEMDHCTIDGVDIYWKPLTGRQQKIIQKSAESSTAEGICMHVKTRALDKDGSPIFKDVAMAGLMNDYDFSILSQIFFAMTGTDLSLDEIEKN